MEDHDKGKGEVRGETGGETGGEESAIDTFLLQVRLFLPMLKEEDKKEAMLQGRRKEKTNRDEG